MDTIGSARKEAGAAASDAGFASADAAAVGCSGRSPRASASSFQMSGSWMRIHTGAGVRDRYTTGWRTSPSAPPGAGVAVIHSRPSCALWSAVECHSTTGKAVPRDWSSSCADATRPSSSDDCPPPSREADTQLMRSHDRSSTSAGVASMTDSLASSTRTRTSNSDAPPLGDGIGGPADDAPLRGGGEASSPTSSRSTVTAPSWATRAVARRPSGSTSDKGLPAASPDRGTRSGGGAGAPLRPGGATHRSSSVAATPPPHDASHGTGVLLNGGRLRHWGGAEGAAARAPAWRASSAAPHPLSTRTGSGAVQLRSDTCTRPAEVDSTE